MGDIVQFLRDRLTEQAQAARRAATDGAMEWAFDSYYDHEDRATLGLLSFGDHSLSADQGSKPDGEYPLTFDELRHIALHDPARTLRQVAAHRLILDAHAEIDDHGEPACSICVYIDDDENDNGSRYRSRTYASWPCRTVRAVAAIWSDHPDYDPSWSVDRG